MNSFNTQDIYIIMDGKNTIFGRYVRDSKIENEVTFRDCLVISDVGIEFYEMLNVNTPESFEEFSKDNRENLIQIISQNISPETKKPIECFLHRYNGVQYFGELSNRVMNHLEGM